MKSIKSIRRKCVKISYLFYFLRKMKFINEMNKIIAGFYYCRRRQASHTIRSVNVMKLFMQKMQRLFLKLIRSMFLVNRRALIRFATSEFPIVVGTVVVTDLVAAFDNSRTNGWTCEEALAVRGTGAPTTVAAATLSPAASALKLKNKVTRFRRSTATRHTGHTDCLE